MPALNFEGQNLVGNSFRGQNLNGSTFFKARLENVRFDPNAAGTRTQLRSTNFSEAVLINVNASKAIFSPDATFTQPTTFVSATLQNVNLSGADLRKVDMTLLNTAGVNLSSADLTDAILYEANISGEGSEPPNLQKVNLTRADLRKANFKAADFTEAILVDANFQEASLEGVTLSKVNAKGADFRLTNFTDAVVENSIFDLANLGGIALTDTTPVDTGGVSNSFRGANLEGFRAEDINLGSADFRPYDPGASGTVRIWTGDALPSDYNPATNIVITNLADATLPDTTLSNSKFNGANLTNLRAEDLNLNGADFSVYKTSGGQFIATNLTNIILVDNPLKATDVEIVGAKFNSAILNGFRGDDVDLTNADFSPYVDPATGKYITSAINAATGEAIDNPSSGLIRTQLNNANLSDSELVGANMTLVQAENMFAEGANLTNAILKGADLSSINLGLATLSGANFSPWIDPSNAANKIRTELDGAFLENTLVLGSNFTEANLSGANLKFTEGNASTLLISANLTEANLTSATLNGSQLDNADMTGATSAWPT